MWKTIKSYLLAFTVLTLLCAMVTHFISDLILEIWESFGTVPDVAETWITYGVMICIIFGVLFSDFSLFISINSKTFRYQHWRGTWK